MYISWRKTEFVDNPMKITVRGIIEFINDTCRYAPGYTTNVEELYDRYVRYCIDRNIVPNKFNPFARSFKYYAFHNNMVQGIMYVPVNYYHDTPRGIIHKSGWSYYNLACNY